jgi:uncharacterized iron-regulated membrane protein
MKGRKLVLRLHGFVGILAGLLLTVISATGAGIVFQEELDHALNPALFFVIPPTPAQSIAIESILAAAQAEHPELPIWFIRPPKQANQSFQVTQKLPNQHQLQTFVNPYSGNVLGYRVWEHSPVGFIFALHHDLLAGEVGLVLVGITGICLLLMAITGILLWTGWRKLVTGFKIRWQAAPAVLNYDLHNVGGAIVSSLLLLTAVTGVIIVVLHLVPLSGPVTSEPSTPMASTIALGQLLQTADATMPEGQTTSIEFDDEQPALLTVRKRLPTQETGRFDLSTVELNRYSGKVLQATRVVKPEGLYKFMVTVADLHFGTFGGVPTRILYLFLGLIPTFLLVTGLVNWRRRRVAYFRR